jgi:4'-phosphopantetheinyl transferase
LTAAPETARQALLAIPDRARAHGRVYWLTRQASDLPLDDRWLAPSERQHLAGLRFQGRRRDWLLGRWTAKQALTLRLGHEREMSAAESPVPALAFPLASIAIRARDGGAPEALIDGAPAPWEISLSHRGGVGLCALAARGAALGCDVERIEPRSAELVTDFFTSAEQDLVRVVNGPERDRLVALIWSAKESTLKALGEGLRLDTRSVEIEPHAEETGNEWRSFGVCCIEDDRPFTGWWRSDGTSVVTIVVAGESEPPIALTESGCQTSSPRYWWPDSSAPAAKSAW